MSKKLTAEEASVLEAFQVWLKNLLNANCLIDMKPMVFSVSTHESKYGDIMINNGKMVLAVEESIPRYYRVLDSQGSEIVGSFHFEKCLIHSFHHAVEQHFADNYKPKTHVV